MSFNIQELLKKKKIQRDTTRFTLVKIIQEISSVEIPEKSINLHKGNLSFRNISPTLKTHITLRKSMIINKAAEKEIIIRDII